MRFKDVLGLDKIKKELVASFLQNKIAHAQLFHGPRGSGKLALALSYARAINCTSFVDCDSCSSCPSCVKFSKLAHPDLHIVFPVIKKTATDNPLGDDCLEAWRGEAIKNPYLSLENWMSVYKEEFFEKQGNKKKEGVIYSHQIKEINRKLTLKIYEAKYRVVVFWMPEKMNLKSANKFLKLLEEPPKKTVLLLVSEEPTLLLPTVLSRLQNIRIPKYTVQETISECKKEKTKDFLNYCKGANGDLGRVLNYSDEENTHTYTDVFIALMRTCFKGDFAEMAKWSEENASKTRQKQIQFLNYSLAMLRECLIYNYSERIINNMSVEEQKFVEKFATYIHEENSVSIIEIFEKTIKNIKRNANSKIIFFYMELELLKLLKLKRKFA